VPLGTVTKTEVPLNTREQVVGYVTTALEIVDELQPPDDLRAAVFAAAVQQIATKQVLFEQGAPSMLPNLGRLS